jgi:hypothetical protein
VKAVLRNGANIVIATPTAFIQILDQSVLSLKQCVRIVFDEADKLLLMHMATVKQIYLRYGKMAQEKIRDVPGLKSESALRMCKTILVAEKYTTEVSDFRNISHFNSVTVITDNFEAAIHSGTEFKAYFASDDKQRIQHLRDSLTNAFQYLDRIVVCCCTDEDAAAAGKEVSQLLADGHAVVMGTSTTRYDMNQTAAKWNSRSAPVLVVSDILLPTLIQTTGIRNAQCLIHFSIPDEPKSKGQFALRFNLMSDLFRNEQQVRNLLSVLILTNENSGQAHEFTDLYERLGLPVPDNLLQLRNSSPRGLCRRMAATGHCPFQKYFCYKDHFLVKDPKETLPQSGQVKFFIGNIVTANEMYVRIIETRDDESKGEWTQWPHQLSDIMDELNELRDESYDTISDPKPGDMYAVIHGDNVRRVRVLDVPHAARLEHYELERRKYVNVFHVDFGSKTQIERRLLIPLPEQLKKFPDLAHRVFVIGVTPPENLVTWSPESFDFVKGMFERDEFHHLSGWIYITASGCMWMDEVRIHHRLKSIAGGIETIGQTLAQTLIMNGHAVAAPLPAFPDHNTSYKKTKNRFRIQEQWDLASRAFLPKDEMVEVNLIHFKSLSDFHVRLTSNDKCLMRLEKDLMSDDLMSPITSPVVGMICMQRYSYEGVECMNRAIIMRIKANNMVDVFYLDHGEDHEVDQNTLYEIRQKHIQMLPFQAIRCRLDGVTQNKELDPELVYDMTRTEDNEYKPLLAQRIGDPDDMRYTITLHELIESDETEWVYRNLTVPLAAVGIETSPSELLRISKPIRIDDDDEDDPESHTEAERNFMNNANELASNYFSRITGRLPLAAVSMPGFTARGDPGEAPLRYSEADADEEYGSSFPPPPEVCIDPADFDYELDNDLPPDPIDEQDELDLESDDELDLAHPTLGDDIDVEFEVQVDENGDPVLDEFKDQQRKDPDAETLFRDGH